LNLLTARLNQADDLLAAQIMTGGINGASSQVVSGVAMERRLQNLQAMKMIALSTDEFPLLMTRSIECIADAHHVIFWTKYAACPQGHL